MCSIPMSKHQLVPINGSRAISKRAICEPSGKRKTSAKDREGPPRTVAFRKARLSPYVCEEAASGLNRMIGAPTSFRSATQTDPSGRSLGIPATDAITPGPDMNATCTFLDSVISLCKMSIALPGVMSAPVPREDMFLFLVRICGVAEAKYWSEIMGFDHLRSYALLSQLLFGKTLRISETAGWPVR